MLSQKQMFVKKISRQFAETEGSDWRERTEALLAQNFSNHFKGRNVDEAPGFVSMGSSENTSTPHSSEKKPSVFISQSPVL